MIAGFDKERLARIETLLRQRYVEPGLLPNAQLTILRGGREAYYTSMGVADMATGEPLRDDAIFRIYSMTKPIVSLAFMMLVEEGKVALDDPVHRFIPAWRNLGVYAGGTAGGFKTVPTKAPMRMVDLLRHTSGLSYRLHEGDPIGDAYKAASIGMPRGPSLDEIPGLLAEIPLRFSPGEAWNYSVATDIVGHLVGAISGMPLETFLEERIFRPLGMVDTGFFVREDQQYRFTACYSRDASGKTVLFDDAKASHFLKPPKFVSGGGGLVSTTADYLRFVRLLLGRGELDGVRLIAPKTLDLMTANHLPGGKDLTEMSISMFSEAAYAGIGFGLGFATTFDPARTLVPGSAGDYFWGGMASTYFWVDPLEDMAVVFMTQLTPSNAYAVRRELRTLIYAALVEPNG